MKHVIIEPGVCGLTADVRADMNDDDEIELTIETNCKAINRMFSELGSTLDPYEVLGLAGGRPLFETAREQYPIHAGCPTLAGIAKCIEAEANLALPRDASIHFVED